MKDEYPKIIMTFIGLFITLVTLGSAILNLTNQPQLLQITSLAGYVVFSGGILWFVFKAGEVSQRWRWASLAFLYIVTILYFFWAGTWVRVSSLPAPTYTNRVQEFGFENGLLQSMTLGVCDNSQSPWYDHCHEAPQRLKIVTGGNALGKSLECAIEISPDKEQVYSLRLPIDPPVFVDAVSASAYIADAQMFSKISLAAHPSGRDYWVLSDFTPRKERWTYLQTDLQPFKTNEAIAIDEIHIDMYIKKGDKYAQEKEILLDNIALYFPLANTYKTGP